MIDIDNKVVDTIQNALTTASLTVLVLSQYEEIPKTLPCVFIQLTDNSTYTPSQDNSLQEHHARISYQIDVFSEDSKTQVKNIMAVVDTAMQNMKFTRGAMQIVPNIDTSIYRMVATYSAIVGTPVTSDTTTTYQIYR